MQPKVYLFALCFSLALIPLAFAPVCPARAQTAAPRALAKPTLTVLHSFRPEESPYNRPLIFGADGALYGVGSTESGPVYKVTRGGLFHTLAELHVQNGVYSQSPLLLMPDGALMGTTEYGGKSNTGSLFLLTPPHRFQTKHEFASFSQFGVNVRGAVPSGLLAVGADGAVYGTTTSGGAGGNGVAYRWTAARGVEVLHDFVVYSQGSQAGGLTFGPDGALYGVTLFGGSSNLGTLYRLTTDGTYTRLHAFSPQEGMYEFPMFPPVFGPDGTLYGTTRSLYGHTPYFGTVYRITRDGVFSILHTFSPDAEGNDPSRLTVGPDGYLYGTTNDGGPQGYGTVFRLSPGGTLTTLYAFDEFGASGSGPMSGVIFGPDGSLYGTTHDGSRYFNGAVFRLRLPQ